MNNVSPHTMKIDWDRPLFSLGRHSYSRSDVLVAAMITGDWFCLEDQARKGLACVKQARRAAPPPVDVQQAAEDFRYARNLLTVEETEDWLERAGVTFEDWAAYLERSLLRRAWADQLEPIVARVAVGDDELAACMHAEGVCSGALGRFAEALAARVSVNERSVASGRDAHESRGAGPMDDERVSVACARWLSACDPTGADAPDRAARLARIARLEATFQAFLRTAISPPAIHSQVEAHRIDWVRVRWRYIAVSDPQAAREAALCVRCDGECLEAVAQRAGAAVCTDERFLDRIDPPLRDAVLSATPKDLVGPIAVGGRFHLAIVDSKCMPLVEDAEVRRRGEDALVASLVGEQLKHVRWYERL